MKEAEITQYPTESLFTELKVALCSTVIKVELEDHWKGIQVQLQAL